MSGDQTQLNDNPFRVSRLNDSRDFDASLDVDSLNAKVSKSLLDDARRIQGARPDPGQAIPVILSPPGYGKTHLFGRLGRTLGQDALFVFVGAIPDPRRPLEHIRRCVVETLFDPDADGRAPIERILSQLFRPAMIAHVKQQSFPDEAMRSQLLAELAADSAAVLKVVAAAKELASFSRLANSAISALPPHLQSSVVRALVLGWSPAKALARRWLRGEDLSEDDYETLGISDDAPAPLEVLQGVAAILEYKRPMVICCDQLESALKEADGPRQLSIQLMEILAGVPNQYIILSCLQDDWTLVVNGAGTSAFQQRVRQEKLDYLNFEQAADLIARRLSHVNRNGADDKLWPIDRESLEQFVNIEQPAPRVLIRRCAQLWDQWIEGGKQGRITFGAAVVAPAKPTDELFLATWRDELARVSADPKRSPDHVADARFYRALQELMIIARRVSDDGRKTRIAVRAYRDSALAQSNAARYAMSIELASADGASGTVIAAVSTLNGGVGLFYFVKELVKTLESASGAVLIHPRETFRLGPAGRQLIDEHKADGRLAIFALEDHKPAYYAMECALGLLEQAHSGELVLGLKPISYEQCQDLLIETKVLHGLDLLDTLASFIRPVGPRAVKPQPSKARKAAKQK